LPIRPAAINTPVTIIGSNAIIKTVTTARASRDRLFQVERHQKQLDNSGRFV
jgi:hypothetical protein